MSERANILIADDEAAIADLVAELMRSQGFDACACYSGTEALDAFNREHFDLVILDIMMPDIDGFDVCRSIRKSSDVPIMFLSARTEEADQVIAFSIDADDYITKPFRPRELMARVRARLRRSEKSTVGASVASATANVFEAQGIVLDADAHSAMLHDEALKLTPKEFGILAILMENVGAPVSMQAIYEAVWSEPYDGAANNSIMVHIRHLRQKLADIDSSTEFITTIWGIGYKIEASAK